MLTPEEKKKYIEGWKKRNRKQEKRRAELSKKAREKAKKAAGLLKQKYSADNVILFGSLARGKFRENSDIDLAVSGLDLKSYPDIYWEIKELVFPFELDLVPIEEASKTVKRRVKREGVEL